MKTCCRCKRDKPLDDFHFKNRALDIRQSFCKLCSSQYGKKWYAGNADSHKENVARRNRRVKEGLVAQLLLYLDEHPCVDCGESDPIVLDFDHIRGTKTASVSYLLGSSMSWDRVQKEIDKCVVRCANCHRKKTAKERGWIKCMGL